jgi:Recombinase
VPYGMQISEDGWHLIESAAEMQVLMSAVNMIVDDSPMSGVAEELNRQGYRTRKGAKWSAAAVFDLLPRMIEAGPEIFTKEEWVERRRRLTRD